jgi:hypothetical protein
MISTVSTDNHATAHRGTRTAALLAPLGLVMAVLVAVAIHLAAPLPVAPAVAQITPTPSPVPSNGSALVEMGLWVLGGLVLATLLAFAIIARLSRHSAGDDR